MPKPIDITGKKYGILTVIKKTDKRASDGCIVWECLCDCGNKTLVSGKSLRQGNTKSCGCLNHRWRKEATDALKYIDGTSISIIKSKKVPKSNTSGYKGVCKHKCGKWRAYIVFKNKQYHLGLYDKIEDAVKMREIAEDKLFGDFIRWYETTHGKGENNE